MMMKINDHLEGVKGGVDRCLGVGFCSVLDCALGEG